MSKHLVIETHLQAEDSIQNPYRVAQHTAELINDLLEKTYKKDDRQVKTLTVSFRVQDQSTRKPDTDE